MKTLSKTYPSIATTSINAPSLNTGFLTKFNLWAESFEEYRYGLVAALIIIQGCLLIPFSLLTITFADFGYSAICAGVLAFSTLAVLVTNIGILPMKVIAWTFLINVLLNVAIIFAHLYQLL